jgi:chromosomal replication initiation ATPase DnaA
VALAKDIDDFASDDAPVNETSVRGLAVGNFLAHQRNVVLVGGTGTGKNHIAIAIARACIRDGAVAASSTSSISSTSSRREAWIADYLARMDFVILDELGYLPFALSGGQLLFHLISRLYDRRRQDDCSAPRPAHPSLRDRRNRQRELALRKPRLIKANRPCG